MAVKLEIVTDSKQVVTEYHTTVQAAETALVRLKRMFKVARHSISKAIKHVELPLSKPEPKRTLKQYAGIK